MNQTEQTAISSEQMVTAVTELDESSGLNPAQRRLVQRWFELADQYGMRLAHNTREVSLRVVFPGLEHYNVWYHYGVSSIDPMHDRQLGMLEGPMLAQSLVCPSKPSNTLIDAIQQNATLDKSEDAQGWCGLA